MRALARSVSVWSVCGLLLGAGCAAGDPGASRDGGRGGADTGARMDTGLGTVDTGRADAGPRPDVGPPPDMGPFLATCDACTTNAQCGPFGVCAELMGSFACLPSCQRDIPSCPRGFECTERVGRGDPFPVCLPVGGRCCIDEDVDGYGRGAQCMGADCDDTRITSNPGATESCNGRDDNCNAMVDDQTTDCSGRDCRTQGQGYEELAPASCESGMCAMPAATSCGMFACNEGQDRGDRCATTCATNGVDDNSLCVEAAHCDMGQCIGDVPNGMVCDEESDCRGGHCENGFCCDGGVCCSTAMDCPGAAMGPVRTCDDQEFCRGSRGMAACTDNVCGTVSGIRDDTACDMAIEANDCGLFTSVFCNGMATQTRPRCPTACGTDAECDANAHCDQPSCVLDLPDGEACNEDTDCVGNHCQNGFCCASGDCCRNTTDCPASYTSAPVCMLPQACQGTRTIATCVASTCGSQMGAPDDSACTSAIVASDCGPYPEERCSGASDQVPPVCSMGCMSDSECDASAHCDGSQCIADVPDGTACDEQSDCSSNFCANGFCCRGGAGDSCCGRDSDCPASQFGRPSTCDNAMSCQGSRLDPVCLPSNRCATGTAPVPDDSGCAGREASACGYFPSVACTADQDQSAPMCRIMCTNNGDCDFGANCTLGDCVANGDQGDPCMRADQCNTGLQCVDGVCCNSTCTGRCEACNVSGSRGTCAPVPSNTDPAGECGGVSCSGYYSGFGGSNGDQCLQRANAADSACDGNRACQGPAAVCPAQGPGPVTLDCQNTCQRPRGGTCTGTTAGACDNVTAGTLSCGTGACFRTQPECQNGMLQTCNPGAPTGETCDNLDNDCDGVADNNLPATDFGATEVTNSCDGYYLGRIYSIAQANEPASVTQMARIYGAGDVDYYKVDWSENDSTCGCTSFLSTDEDYAVTVTLAVPAGAGSYEICNQQGSCGASNCVTVPEGMSRSVQVWKDDCCSPIGCNGSGSWWFRVRGVGGQAFECLPYTLTASVQQGCR